MSEASGARRHKKANWVPVVAALIRKGDQVLIGQRPEKHSLAGLWEFPGGKIEPEEDPQVALARELMEEVGIAAEIGSLKLACTHSYKNVQILILFYEVLFWQSEPKAKHHLKLEWIHPLELFDRPIPEANQRILDKLFLAMGVEWPAGRPKPNFDLKLQPDNSERPPQNLENATTPIDRTQEKSSFGDENSSS